MFCLNYFKLISAKWKTNLKDIVEKNPTNAASVTLYPLGQAILGTFENTQKIFFWKATSMTLHPFRISNLRGHLITHSRWKWNECSQFDFASSLDGNFFLHASNLGAFENTQWENIKWMQPIWFNMAFEHSVNFTDPFGRSKCHFLTLENGHFYLKHDSLSLI